MVCHQISKMHYPADNADCTPSKAPWVLSDAFHDLKKSVKSVVEERSQNSASRPEDAETSASP
jgi:hypothetical protein